ncbi:hypothetical protein BJ170DRAFT_420779 [Xylariales sp. AK1849]|nr:hypothetical protein BJ170DRAFT_420779 [Xylariales sp. AK1849]
MYDIMSCLGQCFGSATAPKSVSETSGGAKYVDQLRKKLNKPEPAPRRALEQQLESPAQAQRQQQQAPMELTSLPASTYTPSTARTVLRSQIPTKSTATAKASAKYDKSILRGEELRELYDNIDKAMEVVRYAICGLGCLVDHGFKGRNVNKVTILVPVDSKDVIRSWAAALGGTAGNGDSVGISMRNGTTRQVKVKYLARGFEGLEIVKSSFSNAKVLSLASQLNHITTAYLPHFRNGIEGVPRDIVQAKQLRTIETDILWCLRRAAETRTPMLPRYLGTFLSAAFWGLFFEQAGVEAVPATQRAGIDIESVLEGHERNKDVREHNAMLAQHNMRGLSIVADQPGLFEGMRGLGRTEQQIDSVYTLQSKDSQSEIGVSNAGPVVPGAGVGNGAGKLPKSGLGRHMERVSVDEPRSGRSASVRPKLDQGRSRQSLDMVKGRGTPEHWV